MILRRRAARSVLSHRATKTDHASCLAHSEAAEFEKGVRSSLQELIEIASVFGEKLECPADRSQLLSAARRLATWLDGFRDMANRLDRAPSSELWPHVEHLAHDLDQNRRDDDRSPLAPLVCKSLLVLRYLGARRQTELSLLRRGGDHRTEKKV